MIDPEKVCLSCFQSMDEPKSKCPSCGCDNSTISNESHQLECGSILAGTYLVGKVLGQGGFGITYVGWDLNLNMKVAIKEYYPEGCVTRDTHTHVSVLTYAGAKETYFQKGKERFVEEARILARFSGDSGIVGVRAFFYENGTAYIVMDFVEGETLKSYAARSGGKLPSAEVLSLFQPLIKSLARVHDNNLLHRDISPDNIMIRPDGTLALLDFGAARQISAMGERSNTINVKHGYAPEEQYRTHGEQGPWTDVYALCATIYRLTTGVTPTEALDRGMNGEELRTPNQLGADFTPTQQGAIMRGLAIRANQRTQDMRQLAAEFYESVKDVHSAASVSGSGYQPTKKKENFKQLIDQRSDARFKQAAPVKTNDRRLFAWLQKPWLYIATALVCIVAVAIALIANLPVAVNRNINGTDAAAEVARTEAPTEEARTLVNVPDTIANVCIGPEPATLDPNMNESVDGMIYITHLYEGLYRPNTDDSFSLGQAKDVTITDNPDGTAHVVATLRDDIFWSDGVPVTAQDFVYSWIRLCDPATGSSYGYIGQEFFANGGEVAEGTITPDQLSVKAVDDKTLEFDIKANVPYTKDLLAFPSLMPLRRDIVEANPEGWSVEVDTQVFNGRYLLTTFAHESQIVLTMSTTYWDASSTKLGTLNCMLSDDDNAILAAFKAGDLDLADSFPTDELVALRATPEYTQYGQIGLYYLQLQQMDGGVKVLKDANVRKALSLAIDREYLNQTIWGDHRIPAYSIIPVGILDATPGSDFRKTAGDVVGGELTTNYATNVARAKVLLAAAGYPDGKGFPKLEYSINENTGHQAVAEALKKMWKENLGIDVEIATMDWATFQQYRKTTDSEIARQGWIGDYTDPATFFDLFISTSGTNDGHYNNAKYDELVNAARTEMDPVMRMQKYHEAETIIMDDMGIIPIVFYGDDVLAQTYFTGFGVTGTGLKIFWEAIKEK